MRIKVCGVEFDDIGVARAVREVLEPSGDACFVVTPNALMLEDCAREPAHRRLLESASLVLPDGAGVVRAAKRAGTPFRYGRVAGIDFGEELMRACAARGERVFLLGGRDGVAARAAENLRQRYPSLCVCGTFWGYAERDGEENRNLIGIINACRPSVLLVCLGYPAQEEWIADNLPRLSTVRVAAGLGGTFDVWANDARRAPALWQRSGMEWAWRMLREPHRLAKLPSLIRFLRLCRQNASGTDSKLHME